MSRRKPYDNWDADLADLVGLTAEQLLERRDFAARRAEDAVARRAGRNPKAARDWRERLRAAEAEPERRGRGPR